MSRTNTYCRFVAGVAYALLSLAVPAAHSQEIPNQSEEGFQKLMPVTGKVETFFGEFNLNHSFPAPGEADKIDDLIDHQRAFQLDLWGLPLVGMTRWHQGYYDAYEDYDYNTAADAVPAPADGQDIHRIGTDRVYYLMRMLGTPTRYQVVGVPA